MKELDITRKLIAHEEDQEPYEIDGFKIVEPDGITLFIGQRAITYMQLLVRIEVSDERR